MRAGRDYGDDGSDRERDWAGRDRDLYQNPADREDYSSASERDRYRGERDRDLSGDSSRDRKRGRDWERDRESENHGRGSGHRRSRSPPPYKRRRDDRVSPDRRSPERDRFGRDRRSDDDYDSPRERDRFGRDHRGNGGRNRRSSPPYNDHRGGRDDYSRGRVEDDGAFMNYRTYLMTQSENITPEDAARKYEVYKQQWLQKQSYTMFKDHKDEEWFKEKYSPEYLDRQHQKIAEAAKEYAKLFILEHESGKIDYNIDHDVSNKEEKKESEAESNKEEEESVNGDTESAETKEEPEVQTEIITGDAEDESNEKEEDEDEDRDSRRLISTKPAVRRSNSKLDTPLGAPEKKPDTNQIDPNVLFIQTVPASTNRADLKEVFDKVEGLVKIVLSDPDKFRGFDRHGWVIYDNADSCRIALHKYQNYKMKGFDLALAFNRMGIGGVGGATPGERNRMKITPVGADSDECIAKDLALSTELLKLLDLEREVETPAMLMQPLQELETAKDRLNMNIIYMRKVHLYCYYCAAQYEDEEELERVCGGKHLRGVSKTPNAPPDREARDWIANLHKKIESRLKDAEIHSPEVITAKKALKEKLEDCWKAYIAKEDDKRYRCTYKKCNKLFMAAEFVQKHIRLKHADLISEIKTKAVDDQYFENYMNDPNRIQPSLPSDQSSILGLPNMMGGHRRGRGAPIPLPGPMYGPPGIPVIAIPAAPRGLRGGWVNPADFGAGRRGKNPALMAFGGVNPSALMMNPMAAAAAAGYGLMMPHHGVGMIPTLPMQNPVMNPPPERPSPRASAPRQYTPDPREVRSYVDLDAPTEDTQLMDYRTTLSYEDEDFTVAASSSSSRSPSSATTSSTFSLSSFPDNLDLSKSSTSTSTLTTAISNSDLDLSKTTTTTSITTSTTTTTNTITAESAPPQQGSDDVV